MFGLNCDQSDVIVVNMKILMVCLGNICRSPLAQGILEDKCQKLNLDWEVDSAGTSQYHIGGAPDTRSIEKAREYGIDISHQRARQVGVADLEYYDLILTMDSSNYQNVQGLVLNNVHKDKIKLVLNYVTPGQNMAVPDPYYDGGFQRVYELLDMAMDQLIISLTT